MIEYNKNKYLKVEFSEYELQIIWAIICSSIWQEGYWYSKQNLKDVENLISDVCVNGISKTKP